MPAIHDDIVQVLFAHFGDAAPLIRFAAIAPPIVGIAPALLPTALAAIPYGKISRTATATLVPLVPFALSTAPLDHIEKKSVPIHRSLFAALPVVVDILPYPRKPVSFGTRCV